MLLIGVDGSFGGWLCVVQNGGSTIALVVPSIRELLARFVLAKVVAIDVPIGLTDQGSRVCDVEARRLLGRPRASSVFPAPVRAALSAVNYQDACRKHQEADGRSLAKQTFAILPKIREVDQLLSPNPMLQATVREVHPELCFAVWNAGQPMRSRKSKPEGRAERQRLIEHRWPGLRASLVDQLRGQGYKADDLNDALAALWSAERIHAGTALLLPTEPVSDRYGLRMEMWA